MAWSAASPAAAEEDPAAAMARALQDPLASLKAIITDNAISFDGGQNDDTSYNFQLQPVYSIPNETSMNFIARAVIPILGIEPGVVKPPLGPDGRPVEGSKWGLSDTILQLFVSPRGDGSLKWGVGPQVSMKTRTSDRLAGAGWGAGITGILVGSSGPWSYSGIVAQHWGKQDDFELATIQPMIFYNFESVPGLAIGYNNSITYNWNAISGNKWNVPLGLMVGRTFAMAGGNGVDVSIGAYKMVERPENSPEWEVRFGVSFLFN